ncbi:putative quinol monooxygenase [Vibrio sp. TBV020]|uniref:putative quinol monooxygenase n=1 Tax=Vibrio sp. TBV020 TaxID=3137398 RepID=UPI0038CD85CC
MDSTIYVTAQLMIKPEMDINEAKKAIEQFCLDMESEAGCLKAQATYDVDNERSVILWEEYADKAAIEAHFSTPHTQAFIAKGMTELVRATNSQK